MEKSNKVGIYILIDPEVEKGLRELIHMKYTQQYGALSQEVQDAITHWINQHRSTLDEYTKTHTKLNPRSPRLHSILRMIIKELPIGAHQVRREDLDMAIGRIRGADQRTKDKWVNELVKNGFIKIVGFGIFEVL